MRSCVPQTQESLVCSGSRQPLRAQAGPQLLPHRCSPRGAGLTADQQCRRPLPTCRIRCLPASIGGRNQPNAFPTALGGAAAALHAGGFVPPAPPSDLRWAGEAGSCPDMHTAHCQLEVTPGASPGLGAYWAPAGRSSAVRAGGQIHVLTPRPPWTSGPHRQLPCLPPEQVKCPPQTEVDR